MKHWIFDLDGTLVNSFPPYFETITEIFKGHGLTFTKQDYLPSLSTTSREYFSQKLGEAHVEAALKVLTEKSLVQAQTIEAFPMVLDLLRLLRDQGRTISVWTNRDLESSKVILQSSGLHEFTSILVSHNCVPKPKPSADGLLKIAQHFQCDPNEMIMIGDHEMDVLAGKAGGARTVRASWNGYWDLEPCPHAHEQFFSVQDLKDWISKLERQSDKKK